MAGGRIGGGLRYRYLAGIEFGQKAGLGAVFGEGDHIAVAKIDVGDPLPVDECPVGAGVDDAKAVALPLDPGMPAGDRGQIFIEAHLARRVSADMHGELIEILDLPFQGPLDVYQLNGDGRHLGHTVPPASADSE